MSTIDEQAVRDAEAALVGKVKNVDYAMFKANQTPDKYVSGGRVNVAAFLRDFPDEAVGVGKSGPAPTTAGGGYVDVPDMNRSIRREAYLAQAERGGGE